MKNIKSFQNNMSKYRIVKRTYKIGDYTSEEYEVQKKCFLGFWHNPLNVDACTTGIYRTDQEAKDTIEFLKTGFKKEIVYESD